MVYCNGPGRGCRVRPCTLTQPLRGQGAKETERARERVRYKDRKEEKKKGLIHIWFLRESLPRLAKHSVKLLKLGPNTLLSPRCHTWLTYAFNLLGLSGKLRAIKQTRRPPRS